MSWTKAIILVGGPSVGTRFRPLSLSLPKPLFPIAGEPIIRHHIDALVKVDSIREILLVGFFENEIFNRFLTEVQLSYPHVTFRYLREYQSLGTGGGLYHFRDEILAGNPENFFVVHADIACSFPFNEFLKFHKSNKGSATIMGTKVNREDANRYGCLVASETNEVTHYVEKPQSFVSDLISCGVYLFEPRIFEEMKKAVLDRRSIRDEEDEYGNVIYRLSGNADVVRLEQDILRPMAGTGNLFVYTLKENDFWMQIKTAEQALPANNLYLHHLHKQPKPGHTRSSSCVVDATQNINVPTISYQTSTPARNQEFELVPPVYIHPTALIHPTAKIGPNVSIGPRVIIERGVRIKNAIILDGTEIKNDSLVMNSIVGWDSKLGSWSRVLGEPVMPNQVDKSKNASILGKECKVADEIVIRSCLVLPHKELKSSAHDEVVM